MAWVIFYNPITLSFNNFLWLLIPLCASVAIVYKTIRVTDLRRLPIQVLALLFYMVCGLVALGVLLWLLHQYWPF